MTHEWKLAREEYKHRRVLDRVDELKAAGMWSMRQLKRHREPPRRRTHWDFVLEEMIWMQQDFKQERRWKIATAYAIARAVVEFHAAPNSKHDVTVSGWHEIPGGPGDKTDLYDIRRPSRYGMFGIPGSLENIDDYGMMDRTMDISNDTIRDALAGTEFGDGARSGVERPSPDPVSDAGKQDQRVPDDSSASELFRHGMKQKELVHPDTVNPRLLLPSELDPTARVTVTPSSVLTYFADEHSILENVALAPPNPDDLTPRQEPVDTAVVPVARFMTRKTRYVDMKWDRSGKEAKSFKEQPVRALQGELKYDSSVHGGQLFAPIRKGKDDRDKRFNEPQMYKPQHSTNSSASLSLSMAPWTPEEEEWLVNLAKTYHFNWSLISELLYSQRLAHVYRSPWDCHDKFVQLEGGQSAPPPTPNGGDPSANAALDARRRDKKLRGADGIKKRERLMKTFDAIRKTASMKKRDLKPNIGQQPRRVNLTAHETHLQSQTMAGIDVAGAPLDPLALSALKAQHDAKIRQQQEAQRMAAQQQALNRGPLLVGGAARPYILPVGPGRPMPRPAGLGTPMLGGAPAGAQLPRPIPSQPGTVGTIRIPQTTPGLLQEQLRQIGQAGQMNQIAALRVQTQQAQMQQQIGAPVVSAPAAQATLVQQQAAAVARGIPLQFGQGLQPDLNAYVQNAVSGGASMGSVAATTGHPATTATGIALRPTLSGLLQAQQASLNVFQNPQLTAGMAPEQKRQLLMLAAMRQGQVSSCFN
ncbi:hypothetical protein M427DRAFT_281361 [Gonapodya prolifera JEL478]|uniref:Vacuolar import and degradation protein 21 n=1 Tax=Gonapodya prolifera (strain JEL478) TaxID=1344416 RepID=A0A139AYU8_GONPJ|nr:hypothetical protein M427DRAFT_281361 [Gonapodya prolifera JEL478]|eukprot:KXS21899.1 hypothetical protein M427DRAFT_281361 [Gonapodya prolifera JEL478]